MFGILDGIWRQREANERVKRLEKQLGSARIKGEKHCLKCGFCCHARPCVPTPYEIDFIAGHLGMSTEDAIEEYFVVDRQEDIYYLKPAGIKSQEYAGGFLPSYASFDEGHCVFLDDNNLCKIYAVRPQEARETNCWDDTQETARDTWKPDLLLKLFNIDGAWLEDCSEYEWEE